MVKLGLQKNLGEACTWEVGRKEDKPLPTGRAGREDRAAVQKPNPPISCQGHKLKLNIKYRASHW